MISVSWAPLPHIFNYSMEDIYFYRVTPRHSQPIELNWSFSHANDIAKSSTVRWPGQFREIADVFIDVESDQNWIAHCAWLDFHTQWLTCGEWCQFPAIIACIFLTRLVMMTAVLHPVSSVYSQPVSQMSHFRINYATCTNEMWTFTGNIATEHY